MLLVESGIYFSSQPLMLATAAGPMWMLQMTSKVHGLTLLDLISWFMVCSICCAELWCVHFTSSCVSAGVDNFDVVRAVGRLMDGACLGRPFASSVD